MADVSAAGDLTQPKRAWRAIPPLRGRVLAVYTTLWWVAVAVAIAAMSVGAVYQHRSFTQPVFAPLGIDIHSNEGFLQIALAHSAEARRAGLDYGDEVVAIDGRPLPRTSREGHCPHLAGAPRRGGRQADGA